MQRLGLVLHVSPSNNIIVKMEKPARIGDAVVDENLKVIGKIFDVFGPVVSPYAAIRPSVRNAEALTNRTMYVVPSIKRKEKRKNERQQRNAGRR